MHCQINNNFSVPIKMIINTPHWDIETFKTLLRLLAFNFLHTATKFNRIKNNMALSLLGNRWTLWIKCCVSNKQDATLFGGMKLQLDTCSLLFLFLRRWSSACYMSGTSEGFVRALSLQQTRRETINRQVLSGNVSLQNFILLLVAVTNENRH